MISLNEAISARHSVRSFSDKRIEGEIRKVLEDEIAEYNSEGGLNIQLITDEPEAFDSFMARRGKFVNVRNYLAMVGPESGNLEEKLGYYGERLVISAQRLGLNTCWVGLTFSKKKCKSIVGSAEKQVCVVALGYGNTQGIQHKSRSAEEVSKTTGVLPEWFSKGIDSALLAPTAVNNQRFMFELKDNGGVVARSTGGAYSAVNLGIVKYHFEVGAGKDNFVWE